MILDFKSKYKYPAEIETYSHDISNLLHDFFEDEKVDPEIFYKLLCDYLVSKWVEGDILLSENEIGDIMKTSMIDSAISKLEKIGLIGSYTTDDGVVHPFIKTK
jgi:hypothetical protein